eukprot:2948941-Karenia_brevis.AAC.1
MFAPIDNLNPGKVIKISCNIQLGEAALTVNIKTFLSSYLYSKCYVQGLGPRTGTHKHGRRRAQ